MTEFSISPPQGETIDGMHGVVVEQDSEGTALVVTPDLAEWFVDGGGGLRERQAEPKDLTVDGAELDVAKILRRPMTPAAVRWKVQTALGKKADPNGALIVPYIDARIVADRLDTAAPGDWFEGVPAADGHRRDLAVPAFQPVDWGGGRGAMLCRLTVNGITHEDVGTGTDAKELRSDAFKRAAVMHGVGRFLYAITKVKFPASSPFLYWTNSKDKQGNPIKKPWLKDEAEAELARIYLRWLWEHGVKAFGVPLDHGDSMAAVGDFEGDQAELEAPGESDPDAPPTESQKARREMRKKVAGEKGEGDAKQG
jgi:hypothetical protein